MESGGPPAEKEEAMGRATTTREECQYVVPWQLPPDPRPGVVIDLTDPARQPNVVVARAEQDPAAGAGSQEV
jgi:hypothetical protein